MKPLWAVLSTLVITTCTVVTGVATWAAAPPSDDAADETAAVSSAVPGDPADGFFWQLTTPQTAVPGQVLIGGKRAHVSSKGTRSDQQFFQISSTGSNDVPAAALRAYRHAAQVMAATDPSCRIPWTLLAAIGRVESNHGRFGGAQLGSDGVSRPEIRGPELNGAGAFAAIRDTDRGVLDHDTVWDRAVGQMQFLPETWRSVARDGDGDGVRNPDDIDDSALGSAVYLCGAGGSLADAAGAARAAFRYNHSDYYVQLVLSFENGYQTGVFSLPSPPPPEPTPAELKAEKRAEHVAAVKARQKAQQKARAAHAAQVAKAKAKAAALAAKNATKAPQTPSTPQSTPTPKPTPTPTAKPTPTPSAPALVQVDGTWNACGNGYCLGTTGLDLGSQADLAKHADADFDGDGTVETNAAEFAGLVGTHVTVQAERASGGLVVYVIGGKGYRNADGSFARVVAPSAAASATP